MSLRKFDQRSTASGKKNHAGISGRSNKKAQSRTAKDSSSGIHEDDKDPSVSMGPAAPSHPTQADQKVNSQNRYKNYAGISSRSVRCYWEQFNGHLDLCPEEVYMRVAEDVTYKLWELGNALKVYSRHTGGRVTTDLVNVVLKDMNVPPVLGANSSNWDTLDCSADDQYDDGPVSSPYFFNSDRVVDLREEYMKEYQMLQQGPTSVTSTWCVEDDVSEDLLDLFEKLCDAIFLGDEETFIVALEVADSHPFICGIISLVLNKCTEMLAFDYKKSTLERTVKLLIALTGNSYLDQNHVDLELYYLSQLMINLLLGSDNDKYFEALPKLTNGEGHVSSESVLQPLPELVSAAELMDYTEAPTGVQGSVVIKDEEEEQATCESMLKKEQIDGIELQPSRSGEEILNGIDNPTNGEVPVTHAGVVGEQEMKHNYEELFIMMDNGEFGMKKLEEFQIKAEPTSFAVNGGGVELKSRESERQDEVEEPEDEEEEDQAADDEEEEEMCVITTKMCDTEDVALVCQCMGRLAGFWSYMYRECSYLLLRRIDQFFLSGVILLKCEYEWLVRAIQAVFALGEVPFREFSAHIDKLHVTITPDWVTVQLNCCGVFLRDQEDSELYDLLYELCGDAILPFMLYRFMILRHLATAHVRSMVIKYRIVSKVVPKLLVEDSWARTKRMQKKVSSMDTWFEDRGSIATRQRLGKAPRIGFKFAGCRPMPVKNQAQQQRRDREAVSEAEDRHRTNEDKWRVVVARRKLLRPLTNLQSRVANVYDLSSIHF